MTNDIAIRIKDLTVAYDGKPVLWRIGTVIPYGQLTAIVGPNGAGKSTLLNTILQFIKPLSGQITYYHEQQPIAYRHTQKRIAYVPQTLEIDWYFPTTVFDVVLMGRYSHLRIGQRPTKADKAIAKAMLAKVGMTAFAERQIAQLSGGQRQRVFLARAFCQEANIIILDEPLAGVDIKTEKIIMDLLREESKKGKAIIAVHHDLQTIETYFDQVIFINRELVASGPVKTTYTSENIAQTYRQKQLIKEA